MVCLTIFTSPSPRNKKVTNRNRGARCTYACAVDAAMGADTSPVARSTVPGGSTRRSSRRRGQRCPLLLPRPPRPPLRTLIPHGTHVHAPHPLRTRTRSRDTHVNLQQYVSICQTFCIITIYSYKFTVHQCLRHAFYVNG